MSSGLIYHAHCPVAVIHDGVELNADAGRAPVLVGIDGSPESELATAIAFDEASRREVGLTALHAWSDVSVFDEIVTRAGRSWAELRAVEDEALAERLAGWGERYPDVSVRRLVVRDEPARQLVDQSECGSARGPRQSRPRRIRRNVVGLHQRRSGAVGPRAGHRCTPTAGLIVLT